MRITIDLPEDVADRLSREAAEAGFSLAGHIIRVLAKRPVASAPEPPIAGGELVEYWTREGIIGSRTDIDDPARFSRALRTASENRFHPLTGS